MHEINYEVALVTFMETIKKPVRPTNFTKKKNSLKTVL